MKRSVRPTLPLITVAALAGCAGAASGRYTTTAGSSAPVNAYVLDRVQLADQRGGLLDAMIGRVPSLRVDKGSACPAVTLRGKVNAFPGVSDPLVYVDGTRTLDTCVLQMLKAADVERVEVYPMGVTSRHGYQGNSYGLILVFMRER